MKNENKVIADGRITYLRKTEKGKTEFHIQSVDRAAVKDIHFIYNGELPDEIGLRKKVHVEGYVVSYRKSLEEGKFESVQYFIAEKVELQRTLLEAEFDIESNFFEKDSFTGLFCGTVCGAPRTENPKWAKLVVAVNGREYGRKTSYIVFSYFLDGRLPKFEYKQGDEVYIKTSLFTTDKEVNGKKKHFEDLQIEDIVKAKKEN